MKPSPCHQKAVSFLAVGIPISSFLKIYLNLDEDPLQILRCCNPRYWVKSNMESSKKIGHIFYKGLLPFLYKKDDFRTICLRYCTCILLWSIKYSCESLSTGNGTMNNFGEPRWQLKQITFNRQQLKLHLQVAQIVSCYCWWFRNPAITSWGW